MERDWARLGETVKAARKAQGLSQVDLAERVGVSRATLQAIERGKAFAKVTPTHRAIATVLGWQAGSVERVLAGSEPITDQALEGDVRSADGDAASVEVSAPTELPLRIRQALADGPLLDSAVISLGDDGGQMVIVVKGKPAASPEQLRRALEEWEQTEAQLRGSDADQDRSPSVGDR